MSKPSGINCNCDTTVSDLLYRPERHGSLTGHPDPVGAPGESGTAGIKSYPYDCYPTRRGEMGWICPVCGRGLAPSTAYCPCRVTNNFVYGQRNSTLEDYISCTTTTPPEAHLNTSLTNKTN